MIAIDRFPERLALARDVSKAEVIDYEEDDPGGGALGSLLCNLGSVLQQPVNGATSAVRGLVNAINHLLI